MKLGGASGCDSLLNTFKKLWIKSIFFFSKFPLALSKPQLIIIMPHDSLRRGITLTSFTWLQNTCLRMLYRPISWTARHLIAGLR